MCNIFRYVAEDGTIYRDGKADEKAIEKRAAFLEHVSGREVEEEEAVRFLKTGAICEEIITAGRFVYSGYFKTEHTCDEEKLRKSIQNLFRRCLKKEAKPNITVTVEEEKPISYAKREKGYDHVVTFKEV